uniref:Uncharacterized protein n=1 Tax=Heterorhabditis bacteriophora TaxID=37862 RepID=A0A1I7WJQ9_HETBA
MCEFILTGRLSFIVVDVANRPTYFLNINYRYFSASQQTENNTSSQSAQINMTTLFLYEIHCMQFSFFFGSHFVNISRDSFTLNLKNIVIFYYDHDEQFYNWWKEHFCNNHELRLFFCKSRHLYHQIVARYKYKEIFNIMENILFVKT